MLDRFFALKEHQTSVSQEVIVGLTTFAAMAYILAVNPSILSTTGMDKGALITATAVASGVLTTVMALATNYPIALAPGMGLNAFFAFTMPLAFSISEGIAFGLLTYVGLKVGTGKAKEVGAVTYALAPLFILHFLFGR